MITQPLMPPVVAHRGASATAPENTLSAIREAARQGAAWVEFDVRLARCGTPVVLHDARLERTTDGRGALAEHEAAALRRLDAGSWFGPAFVGEPLPWLDDVLELASELKLGLNVEVKAATELEGKATGTTIARRLATWSGAVVVSSFAPAALEAARSASPDLALGVLCGRRIRDAPLALASELRAVSLHADRRAFDVGSVETVVGEGLWPVAYTVNDDEDARRLFAIGVRTVITDAPGRLLTATSTLRRSDA